MFDSARWRAEPNSHFMFALFTEHEPNRRYVRLDSVKKTSRAEPNALQDVRLGSARLGEPTLSTMEKNIKHFIRACSNCQIQQRQHVSQEREEMQVVTDSFIQS